MYFQRYPVDWLHMTLLVNRSIGKMLSFIGDYIRTEFTDDNYDFELWRQYFDSSFVFVCQDVLQLESIQPDVAEDILSR